MANEDKSAKYHRLRRRADLLAELPPEAIASIKGMGLDQMFFIYLPGKPLTLVFPGMKTFVEMSLPKTEGIQQQAAALPHADLSLRILGSRQA